MKKLFAGVLTLVSIVVLSFQPSQASALTYMDTATMDNDHGQVNSSYNAYSGSWVRETASSSYLGDHRFNSSNSGGYKWKIQDLNVGQGDWYKELNVYLKSYKFTNVNAYYRLENSTGNDAYVYGYKNQNTAPEGWSRVSDMYNYGWKAMDNYAVYANGNYNTGADGVKVNYYK